MKVAIIGAGGMGRFYAKLIKDIEGLQVESFTDVNERRAREAAKEFGVTKYYTDWRESIKDEEIDAVIITTPVKFHYEITVNALDMGKHVFCEKPPAMNAREAEEMARKAKENKRLLMYAFQYRFLKSSTYVRELILNGSIGSVYRTRIHYLRRYGAPTGFGGWFRSRELAGGGPLIDCAVHFIDLVYWITGRPKPVIAFGTSYNLLGSEFPKFEVEDSYVGIVIFENNMSMIVETSWLQNWHDEHIVMLYGTKAGVKLIPELEIVTKYGGEFISMKPMFKVNTWTDPNLSKLKHFLEIINKGYTDITPTPDDGVVVMKIIDALYRAVEEKKCIEID